MRFTRSSLTIVLFISMLLSGCATSPGSSVEVEPEIILDENTGEPALVVIPNPYLSSTLDVPADIDTAFTKGVELIAAKQWTQAQAHFEQITQSSPQFSGPWVNLGLTLWRQESYAQAAAAFEQATLINPNNGDAYNLYGVMMREQGDFAKSESLYQQALVVWPHNAVAHRNLGVLYDMYMGRFDDAYHHFEMSSKIIGEPDKKLRGWMIDIKRRQAKMERELAAQAPSEAPESNAEQSDNQMQEVAK